MNNWLGCRKCPQFTETPDLRIRDEVAFELDQAYFGSFSARGANEAVLSFSGCEVRSAGMGGVVFARFEAGQWRMVSYRAGPMRDCERTDQQGRTLFLCRPGSAWQGYMDENVVVQDYGNPGPHFLFNLADNTGTACFPEPRDGVYYSGQISAVGWLDLNHDGWRDVAATISFSSELWNTAPTEDACPLCQRA